MERDTWVIWDDHGWDGPIVTGPYTEAEARRRFADDGERTLVKVIHNPPPPFYMYREDPEE